MAFPETTTWWKRYKDSGSRSQVVASVKPPTKRPETRMVSATRATQTTDETRKSASGERNEPDKRNIPSAKRKSRNPKVVSQFEFGFFNRASERYTSALCQSPRLAFR